MKKLSFILFSVILLFAGCRKDKVVITETIFFGDDPEVLVNTSVTGVVVNEANVPIEGARVTLGQNQAQTDDNGFFYLKDILANENGAVVAAEKSGYYPTSQLVYPKLNSVEFIRVKLIKSNESGIITASQGGVIQAGGGASVEFPADAFELNGTSYSGEVSVHATYIDPLADDLFERMPGSLIGVDNEGRIVGMETFGMIGVDMYASSGDKVELASGKTAKITFPVSPEIIGEAPDQIHLWHYDMEKGYWMEEGRAELEGDQYIANVSHFSFWNCDAPFELVQLEGRIVNSAGEGVIGAKVHITRNTPTRSTGYGITDQAGYFRGKVPKGEPLEMEIYDPCGNLVSSESIGPFSNDVTIPDVVVSQLTEVNLTASVVDCSGQPVGYGYVKAVAENGDELGYITTAADGTVDGVITLCEPQDFEVIAVDLENALASDAMMVTYQSTIDLGILEACDIAVQTFNITVDDENYIIAEAHAVTFVDTSMGPQTKTVLQGQDAIGYFQITVNGEGEGTFEADEMDLVISGSSNRRFVEAEVEVTFTTYDGPGPDSYVRGTLEGTIYDNTVQGTVDISGSFSCLHN